MDDQQFWDLAFATVTSIRFHPRNDKEVTARSQVEFAATVADLMVAERRLRCQPDGQH
jgi:hypothetical protein